MNELSHASGRGSVLVEHSLEPSTWTGEVDDDFDALERRVIDLVWRPPLCRSCTWSDAQPDAEPRAPAVVSNCMLEVIA